MSYSQEYDGEVCMPFLFPDIGQTFIQVYDPDPVSFEGFDCFNVVGIPEYLDQETKDGLQLLCADVIFELVLTGDATLTVTI